MPEENKVQELIAAARVAMANAHAPYSRFAVGAAVRLIDGSVITGCNFENASYGLSLCAETVALASVNAQGRFADVAEIAVVGGAMDANDEALVTPCGRCRQIMNEAEQMAGRTLAIYCATPSGDRVLHLRVADLLPHAFGPADLGIGPTKKS
ncbi:cytidine deaminase [Sphingobium sp.]|uniref:cytidine deaminase n=1 Tax=Sphingobium sp. TaxID=1912891 RepID=UPI002CDC5309|nr:cytidine deaminase [Sphingobium sp.]HUD94746.1 cytidine deaminase [Sphingobium sp.]